MISLRDDEMVEMKVKPMIIEDSTDVRSLELSLLRCRFFDM